MALWTGRNFVWYLHYYGRRITSLVTTVPFWVIEKQVLGPVWYERLNFYQRHGYWPHRHTLASVFRENIAPQVILARPSVHRDGGQTRCTRLREDEGC